MVAFNTFRVSLLHWIATASLCLSMVLADSAYAANLDNRFAVVNADGSLIAGSQVTDMWREFTGQYVVYFNRDVSSCAFVATTAHYGSRAHIVSVSLIPDVYGYDPYGVFIETKGQDGGVSDSPFTLVADCDTPGMPYAVVDNTGNLVRSTPGTTLTYQGFGRYNVTFPSAVNSCAFLATVGDPANQVVHNIATVYTGSGPNANTVYVETKHLSGGLQPGVPFYLVAVCPSAKGARSAVVNASGLTTRASARTSSYLASNGEFVLVEDRMINNVCGTVATRGSNNAVAPYTPATVETFAGPVNNTVGIEMRNLQNLGGDLINQALHMATVCP